ncbi:MAG: hypothetical protein ACAI44_13230 [Candidatus Sericytochromatia bacterium]
MHITKRVKALALVSVLSLCACVNTAPPIPAPDPNDPDPIILYDYDLPLTVMARPECQGTDQLIYEVSRDGTFRYYPGSYNPFSGKPPAQLQQRQLSPTELRDLDDRFELFDIAKAFEASKPVPPGSPQTTECRMVTEYSLQVNGHTQSFDANGRAYVHTQAYRNAIERLRLHLESLKPE